MNIVKSAGKFVVYGDAVQTFKKLPPATFEVQFSKMQGFYLVSHNDLQVNEKIYGPYAKKVDKVVRTFKTLNRNMGVILSGPKGVGKSMFARQLAKVGNENDLPLILVSSALPGIESFISSIEQECIVLFDEFDKTFKKVENFNPQDTLLSLFDGVDDGKKLYVITCNNTRELSSFLLNRPGRFHYHFVIGTPSADCIREYLEDNLIDDAKHNIDKIVALSNFSVFTYDVLRAIVVELNQGYELSETLADLNIERDRAPRVKVTVVFKNGLVVTEKESCRVDITSDDDYCRWIDFEEGKLPEYCKGILGDFHLKFPLRSVVMHGNGYTVDADECILSWDSVPEDNKLVNDFIKSCVVDKVILNIVPDYYYGDVSKFLL